MAASENVFDRQIRKISEWSKNGAVTLNTGDLVNLLQLSRDRINELEQENARLKKHNAHYKSNLDTARGLIHEMIAKMDEKK